MSKKNKCTTLITFAIQKKNASVLHVFYIGNTWTMRLGVMYGYHKTPSGDCGGFISINEVIQDTSCDRSYLRYFVTFAIKK